jgi:hypothetical protein
MPGIQDFTYANWATETVRGTPLAPTRQLYAGGTGVLDIEDNLSFHEAENRGVRTRVARATSQAEDVNLKLETADGVGYDDLTLVGEFLKGGVTPTGAGADRTWTFVPSMTAANSPESVTFDVGDDTQNWRCQYCMATKITISSALGELTKLGLEMFAQRAIKAAKATPATNVAVKIPGDLWTVKFATTLAGLPGAAISTNFLLDWKLELTPGNVWRHYMDGNAYGAQHVETSIGGVLSATVESTALAVSEIVDKYRAQTLDFVRLKATGPVLGGSNYSAQLDLPILWDKPQVIGAESDGVNLYKASARLAYDPTGNQSIGLVLVNSLTAKP